MDNDTPVDAFALLDQLQERNPSMFDRLMTRQEIRAYFRSHPFFQMETARLRTQRSGQLFVYIRRLSDGVSVLVVFQRIHDNQYRFGGIGL